MFHIKHHLPGTPPATLQSPPGTRKPEVTLIEYSADSYVERTIGNIEEVFVCAENEKVSWINVDGLGDVEMLRALGERFGLHPLALEDVLNTSHRPKLEEYPEHFFIVARMITMDDSLDVCGEQVSFFLGRNFLISIQEDVSGDVFDTVRKRIRKGAGFSRKMGCDYLCYTLLDAIVDHLFPVLERLGEGIEDLEVELLDRPNREALVELHTNKRILLQLRRTAWPQRDVLNALARDDSGLIHPQTKVFLRDCYDHTVQIMDIIESYRDLTTGLMDIYLSSVSMRTNEIMRILTVVTTIFIPLTFIAGVYGMNFKPEAGPLSMPELSWRYGYVACLTVMAGVAAFMLLYFRRKRWL